MTVRTMWAVGISALAFLLTLWLIPAGMPIGFVPVIWFGIAAFWLWRHEKRLQAQFDEELLILYLELDAA